MSKRRRKNGSARVHASASAQTAESPEAAAGTIALESLSALESASVVASLSSIERTPATQGTAIEGPPPRGVPASDPGSFVGRVLDGGRYRIDAPLGAGGVGAVYRATQLNLGRPVAIKVMLEGLHPTFAARFEREAAALAALRHPNIVTVLDSGIDAGVPYLVMELIEGQTLFQRLQDGPLPEAEVLTLARQLLRALAFVHEQGLVHRDLKPGNILIERLPDGEERLRVLDFGLAKFIGAPNEGDAVTRAGDILGTPSYMAPEQVAGDAVDPRTDLYAVGTVLYQMLADGQTPFEGSPVELLRAQLTTPAPALGYKRKDVRVRPELEALLARALEKPRDERFQSAAEMLAALEAIATPWLTPLDLAATEAPTRKERAEALAELDEATRVYVPPATQAVQRPIASSRARASRAAPATIALVAVLALVALAASSRRGQSERVDGVAPAQVAPDGDADHSRAADEAGSAALATVAASAGQASAALPSKPAARNPWSRPAPRLLDELRRAALDGARGSERDVSALRRYNREHATDARGNLVLAQLYKNRAWRSDAVHQYRLAYERDARARGAPEMLRDLVLLAAEGEAAGADARALIQRAYGAEATAALDRALAAPDLDKPAAQRLAQLRASLR